MAEETSLDRRRSRKGCRNRKPLSEVFKEERKRFVRYTPRTDAPGYNPNIKQRIIRMVEAQVDPMEPPKFKQESARRTTLTTVPIMHSPDRKGHKGGVEELADSTMYFRWKNARGYTIPLDKRLAADGRGLQETTVNNKFAICGITSHCGT